MIATALPILRLGLSRGVNGHQDECSIDTTLGMTNLGTAAIRRSAAGDRAVVASGRDDEGGVFARHVDLPRGPEREIVRERKRSYELNGRESAALATIAAFRVVQVSDVQEMLGHERGERPAEKSLDHLQASGLLERILLERRDEDVVVLTNRGRDLLEANRREHAGAPRQVFYAGLKKPRELTHDAMSIARAATLSRRFATRAAASGASSSTTN